MIEKIELGEIDTSVAEDNFIKLLDENKTYFLNGTWGSGKSEFLHKVENKTEKKMIYLDLWNVKDNRTVMNIVFYKLSGLNEYCLKVIIVFCVITSILMSNVVNLGIATRLGLSNSHILLQLAGIIALIVATFQVLKIQSDNIFVSLLSKTRMKNKVLIIDDFDRVDPKKQEEAYKMFNILNQRLPIIFVGDYTKIANNEGNYLQKIIDRRIELPYILSPQSIWNDYFNMLEELLNFEINVDLKSLIISEKRNLREQFHFNDYINLEFLEKSKLGHVQINQQLMMIYLYLFHNKYYQKLIEGWFPKYTLTKDTNSRYNMFGYSDNAIFENEMEKVIYDVLCSNTDYPEAFYTSKQGYYLFENISNLSIEEAKEIVNNELRLRNELINMGNIQSDFYKFVSHIYSTEDKFKEEKNFLENASFHLIKEYKTSTLVKMIANKAYDKSLEENLELEVPSESEQNQTQRTMSIYDTKFLGNLDISEKIYVFLELVSAVRFDDVSKYFMTNVKEIVNNEEEFKKQNNKGVLLSMYIFKGRNREWIEIENWDDIVLKRVNQLTDQDYISFWYIYRIIDVLPNYRSNFFKVNLEEVKSITIRRGSFNPKGLEHLNKDYSNITEKFEDRVKDIAKQYSIELKEINKYENG